MTKYLYTNAQGRREVWTAGMLKQHAKNLGNKQKLNNVNEVISYIMKVQPGSYIERTDDINIYVSGLKRR